MYAHTPQRLCHDAPAGTAAAAAGTAAAAACAGGAAAGVAGAATGVAGAAAGAAGAAACADGAAACADGAADGGARAAARLFIVPPSLTGGVSTLNTLNAESDDEGVPGLLDESVSGRDVA